MLKLEFAQTITSLMSFKGNKKNGCEERVKEEEAEALKIGDKRDVQQKQVAWALCLARALLWNSAPAQYRLIHAG